jgi:hypothetical protein
MASNRSQRDVDAEHFTDLLASWADPCVSAAKPPANPKAINVVFDAR